MKYVIIFLITFYQKAISPWLPRSCRFYPTCSQYAKAALKKYGFLKGSWLALKRVSRCHPFNEGGYDPLK